jgi:hypothetical protein
MSIIPFWKERVIVSIVLSNYIKNATEWGGVVAYQNLSRGQVAKLLIDYTHVIFK